MNSVKPNSYAWNIKCLHYQAANIYGLEQVISLFIFLIFLHHTNEMQVTWKHIKIKFPSCFLQYNEEIWQICYLKKNYEIIKFKKK